MDIAPQDLGPDYCTQVFRWRDMVKGGRTDETLYEARGSWASLGAILGGPAGLFLGVPVAWLLHLLHAPIEGVVGSDVYFVGTYILGIGGGGTLGFKYGSALSRRRVVKVRAKAVTEQELAQVGKNEKDALKRDYLNAVAAVVALSVPHEEGARHSIREAVRSLGQAVGQVPPPRAAADVGALRAEAGRLAAQARDEPDPVIAASLVRQSEAFGRRADTAARVAVLARRGQALRDEVAAQVQAFRAGLTAAQINGGHGGGDFTALAESVAQVMQEADALADARAELEAALAPAAPAQDAAAAQRVGLKTT